MKLFLLPLCLFLSFLSFSQIGVNTTEPKATLDVVGSPTSTTLPDGIIQPKLTGDQLKAKENVYGANQQGAVVYVTSAASDLTNSTEFVNQAGLYVFDGVKWQKSVSNASSSDVKSNVYTIGSNLSMPGVPLTSNLIKNAAHILVDTASNINLIISNAYDSGFRKIYFQEGLYLVNEPIDLSNKTYLKIEGAGSGTVFKPAIGYDLASYLFNLQNVERLLLNDFSIDLKTSTSNGQDVNDLKTGIRIASAGQNNTIKNIFFECKLASNATVIGESPILIELSGTEEADYNHFDNIRYYRHRGGIVLNMNGGIFNHNTFTNFHLHYPLIGVDFQGTDGIIEGNLFSNFDVQASKDTSGLRLRTTNIIRNVRGAYNSFYHVHTADFLPDVVSGTEYFINITENAERITVENCETEGTTGNASYNVNGAYADLGKGTQFINNASGNRRTDYYLNNINEYSIIGRRDISYDPINIFRSMNFNNMLFRGHVEDTSAPVLEGTFTIDDFKNINIGKHTNFNTNNFTGSYLNPYFENRSLTHIRGDLQIQPHISGIIQESTGNYYIAPSANPTAVLTNRDNNGNVQWTKINDLPFAADNLFNSNGSLTSARSISLNANPLTIFGSSINFSLSSNGGVGIYATPATNVWNDGVLKTRGRLNFAELPPYTVFTESSANVMLVHGNGHVSQSKITSHNEKIVISAANGLSIANNALNNDYLLLVNGKVKAHEYLTDATNGWADYVFDDKYILKPLSEVEKFIKKNKHLPNFPSEKEIVKNGIELGKITTLQQEKIEELTLYAIKQDKKIEDLNKEVEELKKIVKQLLKN